ncbi:MAG: hypothetical protein F8N36_13575 [Desulfovibrio sp.]|uniref:hypothetical protein n=1 Tax=Desulfovibrio sp. TaxID=885 RepID=UPI00135D2055|nr:hypothetical protein [Desulfovibrio sp.]MTJ93869.1 hypothetical protein [Desulfovibrio sp.]
MSGNPVPSQFEAPNVMMRMRSGRWVNLYDPSPLDVDLEDWIYGTSRTPRFGGQCKGEVSYNVLQHHPLVDDILVKFLWPKAPRVARLYAMSHDLHEGGGLGDIVTPYGHLFDTAGLREVKHRLDRVILPLVGIAFPLDPAVVAAVKRADTIAAVSEAVQLMDWPEDIARKRVGKGYRGRLWDKPIEVLDEIQARAAWRERFADIQKMAA